MAATAPRKRAAAGTNHAEYLGSDVDWFALLGPIEAHGHAALVQAVTHAKTEGQGKSKHAVLALVTSGGSPDSAYKMARLFQRNYPRFTVMAPARCYSAGTLIAVGAHDLLVSPYTEFGPLDMQLLQRNELFGRRRSGLQSKATLLALRSETIESFESAMLGILRKSRGAISFRLAAQLGVDLAAGVMGNAYGKLDTDQLGNDFRDVRVVQAYAERLAAASRNITASSIQRLVHSYPTHDFVIDGWEARELFTKVHEVPSTLMAKFRSLVSEWNGRESEPFVASSGAGRKEADADENDRAEYAAEGAGRSEEADELREG